jgi:hypothetical protein
MVKKFPKSFVHSENLIDLYPDLFYRNLSSLNYNAPNDNLKNPKDVPPPIYMQNDKILKIEYKINSDFYRSENFIDPADILILGCSQTYGYGMIDDFTWPHILSKKLNTNFARLALGGDSLQGQVIKAFEYFNKIGKPKLIVATFPIFRVEFPNIENYFEPNFNNIKKDTKETILSVNIRNRERPKYAKSPYNAESILPGEYAIFISFIFIKMLEEYCNSNDIKLIWNFWEDNNSLIYSYIKNNNTISHILNNYFAGRPEDITKSFQNQSTIHLKCHKEYSEHPLFNNAADFSENSFGHWGIHKHIHMAEEFYTEIINRQLF